MGIYRTKFTQYTMKSSAFKMQNIIPKCKALVLCISKPCGLAGDNRNLLKIFKTESELSDASRRGFDGFAFEKTMFFVVLLVAKNIGLLNS